ncbi:pilus assembly PilX N-terminal domain-containing protein [Ectothiorhodospira shaposhnikovii]|uniref:pilus assembly PilX N-terminal domain-containing protein n=1 Tax=Ectothiorhodospira shaposhnikovii TaxID=1054 RepID=UPI001EE7EA4D|nr:pilus assembly PilX N-terminal domain-containing protein [Ectothiorhodospira shaposhnikovii]MCG5513286.1 pilus assembly PilX N-terminal domain-containing protein [Ectothiorhodospira shaposhnikovii]
MSNDYPRQRGVALVVSLVLLAVATLVGVATLNGSFLQERLAGNERQAANAFMAAESGVSEVLAVLLDPGYTQWNGAAIMDAVGDGVHAVPGNGGAAWSLESVTVTNTVTLEVLGIVADTGARRILQVELGLPGVGGPNPESAYTCYGADCRTRTGSNSNNAIYYDGRDWRTPTSSNCTGAGCNGTLNSERDGDVAGIYLVGNNDPNAISTGNQNGDNRADQIQGNPPRKQTDAATTDSGVGVDQWNAYADALIGRPSTETVTVGGNTVDISSFLGGRDAPKVHHITGSGSIRLGGNEHGAGVLIISGDIEIFPANGTITFEGLIILRDGARLSSGSGTANIFGSVISLTGNENAVDADLGGNFTLKYSSEALENLRQHGLWGGSGGPIQVLSWQEKVS